MLKYIFSMFLFLFVNSAFVVAEENSLSYYKNKLEYLNNLTQKIEKEDTYKDIILRNKKTGEEKNFKDFDSFTKKIFIVINIESLNYSYDGFYVELIEALNNLEPDALNKAPNDESIPGKEDLDLLISNYNKSRLSLLNKQKEFIINFFKEFPMSFTEKEKKDYLNNIEKEKEKLK